MFDWSTYVHSCEHHIDGLVQERCNSIANTLELRFSCTKPLIYDIRRAYSIYQLYHDDKIL